jgi:hypothetical protein
LQRYLQEEVQEAPSEVHKVDRLAEGQMTSSMELLLKKGWKSNAKQSVAH